MIDLKVELTKDELNLLEYCSHILSDWEIYERSRMSKQQVRDGLNSLYQKDLIEQIEDDAKIYDFVFIPTDKGFEILEEQCNE